MTWLKNLLWRLGLFVFLGGKKKQSDVASVLKLIRPTSCVKNLCLMGNRNDGSYFIPEDISDIEAVISPGVGPTSVFEKSVYQKFGIKSILVDPTVEPVEEEFVLEYISKFFGVRDDCENISLSSIISRNEFQKIIVQMDIEGGEYSVISSLTPDDLKASKVWIVEFHFLNFLFLDFVQNIISDALRNLLTMNEPVWINVNDTSTVCKIGDMYIPSTVEVTFVNREFFELKKRGSIGLDEMFMRPDFDGMISRGLREKIVKTFNEL